VPRDLTTEGLNTLTGNRTTHNIRFGIYGSGHC
jgi:hypothetical protein